MTKSRKDGLYILLLGSMILLLLGSILEYASPISMTDFKGVYYGARCLIQHCDPYNQAEVLRVYQTEKGQDRPDLPGVRQVATRYVYFPPAFVFTVPFALLGFGPAHLLWMIYTALSFILGAYLMWDVGANHAPIVSACLIAFLLANSIWLFMIGNAAGIAIGLCITAVWCFLQRRFEPAGVLCLALSLMMKPHDVGLLWLYFLMAGDVFRKRACKPLSYGGFESTRGCVGNYIAPTGFRKSCQ